MQRDGLNNVVECGLKRDGLNSVVECGLKRDRLMQCSYGLKTVD